MSNPAKSDAGQRGLNWYPATIDHDLALVDWGVVELADDLGQGTAWVQIPPEAVILGRPACGAQASGVLARLEVNGAQAMITVTLDGGQGSLSAQLPANRAEGFSVGEPVSLSWPRQQVRIWQADSSR